jgi:hypothetical protein
LVVAAAPASEKFLLRLRASDLLLLLEEEEAEASLLSDAPALLLPLPLLVGLVDKLAVIMLGAKPATETEAPWWLMGPPLLVSPPPGEGPVEAVVAGERETPLLLLDGEGGLSIIVPVLPALPAE